MRLYKQMLPRKFAAMFFATRLFRPFCWAMFLALFLSACKDPLDALRQNPDKFLKYDKAMEFYKKKDWTRAQALLEDLIPLFRGEEQVQQVYYTYAYTHYYLGNYTFANYYFKQYYTTYPNSENAEEALFMSAMASYQLSPRMRLSQDETFKALEQFQFFVNSFPMSKHVLDSNEKIGQLRGKLEEKDLDNARGYYHRKQYRSALHCFNKILEEYPESKHIDQVRIMMVSAAAKYAEASVEELQIERLQKAIEYAERFSPKIKNEAQKRELQKLTESIHLKIRKLRHEQRNQTTRSRN